MVYGASAINKLYFIITTPRDTVTTDADSKMSHFPWIIMFLSDLKIYHLITPQIYH